MRNSRFSKVALCSAVFLSGSMMPGLRAATIWTDWTSAASGAPGSASGILDGIAVSYNGEVIGNTVIDGTTPDWSNPASSFIGGTVTTSPSTVGDIIALAGTFAGTNTITFGSPI